MDLVRKEKCSAPYPCVFFPNLFSLEISGFFIIFIIFISLFQALGSWEGKEGRAREKMREVVPNYQEPGTG